MTKIGKFISGTLFVLFLPFVALGATSVQSTVDRNEMGAGDTFTVTVVVSSDASVDAEEPRVPELDGLDLVNKWEQTTVAQKLVNTSKGMQFQTTRRKEFSFMFSTKQMGSLTVPPFEVVVDGKVFRTQAIPIKVSKEGSAASGKSAGKRPSAAQQGMPSGFDSPDDMDNAEEALFNQLLKQRQQMLQQFAAGGGGGGGGAANPGEDENNFGGGAPDMNHPQFRSLPTNPNEAFFVQVEVDRTDVYEGEQITANWYIYTRGQMETLDRLKFPDLRGFWKEIIEEVPTIQFSEELVNGIPYKKALLASHALFPIKAGTAYIDEYKIKSRVRVPVNGMGGFFGRAYEFTKSSEKVKINVKPLPTEGRPTDFTGAVGQFEVTSSVEGQSFPVNQPFSLKLRFEGVGNAKMIDLPAMNLTGGLEVYDTKSDSKFFKNGRSYKEFEVLLIPRQEGEMTIPGLSTSFFDPHSKKYYTKTTAPIKVTVVANPNAPVGAAARVDGGAAPSPAAVVKQNVLPEPLQTWEKSSGLSETQKTVGWSLAYAFILLALLWKGQKELGFGYRKKNMRDLVQKRLKKVHASLSAQDFRHVGTEMTNIFYLILGESVGEVGATQEVGKILEKVSPSLRRDHGADILESFEFFQTLGFAPEEMLGALKESAPAKVQQAESLISKVIAATAGAENSSKG